MRAFELALVLIGLYYFLTFFVNVMYLSIKNKRTIQVSFLKADKGDWIWTPSIVFSEGKVVIGFIRWYWEFYCRKD